MKRLRNVGFLIIIIVGLSQKCTIDLTHDCTNKLRNYPFPYSDRDIVEFKNGSDSIILVDTVKIVKEVLGRTESGDPGHYNCDGYREMTIHDFSYRIDQAVNFDNNAISQRIGFNKIYDFKLKDTILNYNFKNTFIKAFHYIKTIDSTDLKTKYFDFNISGDYKLLDYSLRKDGKIEKWVLK